MYKQLWFWMLVVILVAIFVVGLLKPFGDIMSFFRPEESAAPVSTEADPGQSEASEEISEQSAVGGAEVGQSVAALLPSDSVPGSGADSAGAIEALLTIFTPFGETNVTYETEDNTFYVDLITEGMAAEVALAASGEEAKIREWEDMKAGVLILCGNAKDAIAEEGHETATLMFRLVNDLNTEHTLLLVVNDTIQYDSVHG